LFDFCPPRFITAGCKGAALLNFDVGCGNLVVEGILVDTLKKKMRKDRVLYVTSKSNISGFRQEQNPVNPLFIVSAERLSALGFPYQRFATPEIALGAENSRTFLNVRVAAFVHSRPRSEVVEQKWVLLFRLRRSILFTN